MYVQYLNEYMYEFIMYQIHTYILQYVHTYYILL